MICDTEISPLNDERNDEDIVVNMSFNDGNVAVMHCGYGSKFDTTNLVIALCDNCIDNMLKNGKISVLNIEL